MERDALLVQVIGSPDTFLLIAFPELDGVVVASGDKCVLLCGQKGKNGLLMLRLPRVDAGSRAQRPQQQLLVVRGTDRSVFIHPGQFGDGVRVLQLHAANLFEGGQVPDSDLTGLASSQQRRCIKLDQIKEFVEFALTVCQNVLAGEFPRIKDADGAIVGGRYDVPVIWFAVRA